MSDGDKNGRDSLAAKRDYVQPAHAMVDPGFDGQSPHSCGNKEGQGYESQIEYDVPGSANSSRPELTHRTSQSDRNRGQDDKAVHGSKRSLDAI